MKNLITIMLIACATAVCPQTVVAQVVPDTVAGYDIGEVTVEAHQVTSPLTTGELGELKLGTAFFEGMPKILGNADPMHYTQLLPGVQTLSEYDAGLHIQGSDNQHNSVTLGGVPIYNVSHLLGFFSVFNASHFSTLRLNKSATTAQSTNRLGGFLDMEVPDSIEQRTTGEFTVGPMSSQGTVRTRLGKRSFIIVSARQAYLNWLYGRWMEFDGTRVRYSFFDYNLTFSHQIDNHHRLWVDAYAGSDNVSYTDGDYLSKTRMRWGNYMGALHWETHKADWNLSQVLYTTAYRNRLNMNEEEFSFSLPSSVSEWGYRGSFNHRGLTIGTDIAWHTFHPQSPSLQGTIATTHTPVPTQHTRELSAYADYQWRLTPRTVVGMGLRANAYCTAGNHFYSADPHLTATYTPGTNSLWRLTAQVKHQYLFKTGFSGAGLPTEFWFSADASNVPQYACAITLGHEHYLFNRSWRIAVDAYYKRLHHQIEYEGSVLDFLYEGYQLNNHLLHGQGVNFGLNLMVERRTGRLTGWVSYAVGRALRWFPGTLLKGKFPASHERIHEFNVVATYNIAPRWLIGSTFVYTSGTPFTAPKAFYMVNENILSEFSDHNANKLRPYMRWDLSVNYQLKKTNRLEQGINVSVYNVTAHNNDIYYRLKIRKDKFGYRPLRFVLPLMPSVSYYCKF